MHPFLIDFGRADLPLLGEVRLALPTYGVLVAAAVFLAWVVFLREIGRLKLDQEKAGSLALWVTVSGLVGAKAGLVAVEFPQFLAHPASLLAPEFLQAAGVVWVGLLAGLAAFLLLAPRKGLPVLPVLDAAALGVPLAQALGRIGCLMSGCCFGGRCDLPWGIVYHNLDAHDRTGVPLGVSLHPFPLYEALWNLAVTFPALLFVRRFRRVPGEIALAYLVLYSLGRFVFEPTRGDTWRGIWFGGSLSTSQLISLAVAPAAAAVWVFLRRKGRAAPAP